MHYQPNGGWIEIVCGSMFSGKTEELLRRVRRAEIARKKIQVFKPAIDNRYGQVRVASVSTPAVWPNSGWPGVLLPHWRKLRSWSNGRS